MSFFVQYTSRNATNSLRRYARGFSSSRALASKVAVLGASGGIGQPLSLLLKLSNHVSHLSLYDIVNTPGVAADISHCSTPAKVSGHVGDNELAAALHGVDVVVVPAGVPRKPGMTRDDLFNTNASIVYGLADACAKHCPKAFMLIIANPVNSTVPIVAEAFKKNGVYDPKRLFGVTTLDVVRAKTFVGEAKGVDPRDVTVPVVGGHAGRTILPILSQATAGGKVLAFDDAEVEALTHRIQFGGDEVVKAKDGAGSATLSMAYAGARFTENLLSAINGKSVMDIAYVDQSQASLGVSLPKYFATPITLSKDGVESVHEFGALNAVEQANFDEMVPDLVKQIEKGEAFAASK